MRLIHGSLCPIQPAIWEIRVQRIGNIFPVVKALGEHPQRQGLCASHSLVSILTVGEDTGKLLDLRDPAAVAFPVQLNR